MSEKRQPDIKEFPGEGGGPGNPTVFTVAEGNIFGCTTTEHMKVQDIPLDQYLRQVVEEARKYGDSIFHKYEIGRAHV